jgi:hypothetical protein
MSLEVITEEFPSIITRDLQVKNISADFTEELRLRVSFAKIGLNLTLTEREIMMRLLRSVSASLSYSEQRETIILNAKSLLDVDADSRFFAGRILLTYKCP